jgi:hypothetical protein
MMRVHRDERNVVVQHQQYACDAMHGIVLMFGISCVSLIPQHSSLGCVDIVLKTNRALQLRA